MLKLAAILLIFSNPAQACDLSVQAKKIIFDEITRTVFFEDEGLTRAPSQISDFNFVQKDEFEFQVTGDSYSDWDGKVIHYDCLVSILNRGMIRTADDISLSCSLIGENWPYDLH